jgi:hypothetical protein
MENRRVCSVQSFPTDTEALVWTWNRSCVVVSVTMVTGVLTVLAIRGAGAETMHDVVRAAEHRHHHGSHRPCQAQRCGHVGTPGAWSLPAKNSFYRGRKRTAIFEDRPSRAPSGAWRSAPCGSWSLSHRSAAAIDAAARRVGDIIDGHTTLDVPQVERFIL